MNTASPSDDARIEMASQLRRGMHLLVGRDPSAAELTKLTAQLRAVFDELALAEPRVRSMTASGLEEMDVPQDGEQFADSLDRPISGSGNPFSVPMTFVRDGDMVVSTVTLDTGFEGAMGRSHGGIVSAIFDDLFGSLAMLQHKIAFTASLTVDYVSPSPVREPVNFRGWIDRVEGRKIFVAGDAHAGETLVTRASGLFIDATEQLAALYAS